MPWGSLLSSLWQDENYNLSEVRQKDNLSGVNMEFCRSIRHLDKNMKHLKQRSVKGIIEGDFVLCMFMSLTSILSV